MADLGSQKIRIRMKAYDFKLLDQSAGEIVETAIACAVHVRRFGLEPKIALISHSDFGSADTRSSLKMREALRLLQERAPELEVDGEMQAPDVPLSRQREVAQERVVWLVLGIGVQVELGQAPGSEHPGPRRLNLDDIHVF